MTESFPSRIPRAQRRSNPVTLAVVALASFSVEAAGTKVYDALQSNPLEYGSAVATKVQFDTAPGETPGSTIVNGATVNIHFSVPESVAVADALSNIRERMYADSAEHDAIVGFAVPEGRYAYKVQCDSVQSDRSEQIQSGAFVCDFPIYEEGFIPATD